MHVFIMQIFIALLFMAKKFAGWAKYRRCQKTLPTHAEEPSRAALAPPSKKGRRDLFSLKRIFA